MPKGKYNRRQIIERFFDKVDKDSMKISYVNTKCWTWNAPLDKDGYGRIRPGGIRKFWRAHRASWFLHNGPIPEGLHVLHKCDNPPCVNPNHLFLGTISDNAIDMIKKGRANHHKGESHYKSKITIEQANQIREMYKKGNIFQKDIAKIFNITQTRISEIIRNKAYHN